MEAVQRHRHRDDHHQVRPPHVSVDARERERPGGERQVPDGRRHHTRRRQPLQVPQLRVDRERQGRGAHGRPRLPAPGLAAQRLPVVQADHLLPQAQAHQQPVRSRRPHRPQLDAQVRAAFAHHRGGQVDQHVRLQRVRLHRRHCLSKRSCKFTSKNLFHLEKKKTFAYYSFFLHL